MNTDDEGEDKKLWEKVSGTAKPLDEKKRNLLTPSKTPKPHKKSIPLKPKTSVLGGESPKPPPVERPPSPPPPPPFTPSPIDRLTYKAIAEKKIRIDAKIDLHKLTQAEAKEVLQKFLGNAQLNNSKIVLVVTGKGTEGKGVLRANVPRWLEVPPLQRYVNGFAVAHRNHGGEGALYVRIRKNK